MATLVRYLKKEGHLTQDQQASAGVLDDYDDFLGKANLGNMLDTEPTPRDWAIPQFAPVGKVTVLAGPGGVSKSMLMLHVLVHGALGQSFADFKVDAPLRSLYVSYEDDTQELHSRVHALSRALRAHDDGVLDALYDVNGSVRKNLLMYAADEDALAWVLAAKPDRFAPAERTQRVDWLVGLIKHAGIKLLVLDPAVYTHQLEENDISDMAAYMQMLTYIAKQGDCAVLVLHHMSKAASWVTLAEVNQGALRGASSFADNARSVTVCLSMPIKDAPSYGLPADRVTSGKYVVIQHVKHNYSAPMGQQIFERIGPLLVHRPEIVRLDDVQVADIRQEAKAHHQEKFVTAQVERMIIYLLGVHDFATSTQISVATGIHKRHMREVLDQAEGKCYIECEPGPKKSQLSRLTAEGKAYAKMVKKDTK
jgi:hypothetical protein